MIFKGKFAFRFSAGVAALLVAAVFLFTGCYSSTDWVKRTIENNYYRFDGDYSSLSDLEGLSIEEMMAKLDRYSAYYTYDQYKSVIADNEGNKSGIGVSYTYVDGTGVVIHSVVGNSPAKKAGLKAGDIIISASAGETYVTFNSLDDFSGFVSARGTGEEISLELESGKSVTVAKAEYTASYASMYLNDCAYEIEYEGKERRIKQNEDGGTPQLPDGTAYIYLSQFYGMAAEEIAALLSEFNARHCTSLILDLRDDGGGYVKVMADIAGLFTTPLGDSAIAMKSKYKNGSEQVEYCKDYRKESNYNTYYSKCLLPEGCEVYVMANHNTASASEALIGVLVSYNILKYENIFLSQYTTVNAKGEQVVSEAKSYGKGIMQSTFTNALTGEALKLTVAGIYWANGKTIHDVGLTVADGCKAAPAADDIVNIGYDDELVPVIEKILSDRG